MTEINLLPWRETLRKAAKREWLLLLSMDLLLALFILVTVCMVLNTKIADRIRDNNALQFKAGAQSKNLSFIKSIQQQENEAVVKARTFKLLQEERENVVSILTQVVKHLPSGVYLTLVHKKDQGWVFKGVAQSPLQVSAFLQALEHEPLVTGPSIMQIKTEDNKIYRFEINSRQSLA